VAAIGILITFLVSAGGVVSSSFGAYVDMTAVQTAEEVASRVMDRIVHELRFAPAETLTLEPAPVARSIAYRKVIGWQSDGPVLSEVQTLAFQARRVLASGVPLAGDVADLTFRLDGRTLTAKVSVERIARSATHEHTVALVREVKVSL
jgi:hypothetical protein